MEWMMAVWVTVLEVVVLVVVLVGTGLGVVVEAGTGLGVVVEAGTGLGVVVLLELWAWMGLVEVVNTWVHVDSNNPMDTIHVYSEFQLS